MDIPALGISLYGWQKEALEWMSSQEENCQGGMLCDEMGLGKTVEAMSLVATRPVDKTLIIVPPILIHQWMEWIHKLDPGARVYNIRPRDDHQWEIELDLLQKSKIVITGYMKLLGTRSERVKQNLTGIRKEKSPIHDIYWDRIIVDECHYLQSSTSQRTRAVLSLRGNYRWGLTGTPFAKSPLQMSSLMKFLRWKEGDLTGIHSHSQMKEIVLSRRIVDIPVLQDKMPTLTEHLETVDFTRDEARFYFSIKGTLRKHWLNEKKIRMPGWIKSRGYFLIQSLLQLASLHPELVFERWRQWISKDSYRDQWTESPAEIEDIIDQHWTHPDSSKLQAIDNILRWNPEDIRKRNYNRSLIFLPYRLHIDFMESWLRQKGYSVQRLDGSVKQQHRGRLLESLLVSPYYMSKLCEKNKMPYLAPELWRMIGEWTGSPQILLLQNRVGGIGLNLQSFSQVLFPIPMSTPSLEGQAIARSYRLGQTKSVRVYRFVLQAGKEDSVQGDDGQSYIPQTVDQRQLEIALEKRGKISKWWEKTDDD